MEELNKHITKDFHINTELQKVFKSMPDNDRKKILDCLAVYQEIQMVKWGVITEDEFKKRIANI